MSTSPLPLTVENLRATFRQLIAENPEARNPSDGRGRCLYTARDNPDHHCIVGAALARMGYDAPGPDVIAPASDVLWGLDLIIEGPDDDLFDYVGNVQRMADLGGGKEKWGSNWVREAVG